MISATKTKQATATTKTMVAPPIVKIDLDEIFMSSLTSPTTCYTGSKRPFVRERRTSRSSTTTPHRDDDGDDDVNNNKTTDEVDFYDFEVKSYHLATEYHILTADVVDKVVVAATRGRGDPEGKKQQQQQQPPVLHPLIKTSSRLAAEVVENSTVLTTTRQANDTNTNTNNSIEGATNYSSSSYDQQEQRRRKHKKHKHQKDNNDNNWICGGFSEYSYYFSGGVNINDSDGSLSSKMEEENVVQAYVLLDPSKPTIIENELAATSSSSFLSPSQSPSTTTTQTIGGDSKFENGDGIGSRKILNNEDPRYAAGLRLVEKGPSSLSSTTSSTTPSATAVTTYPTYASSSGKNTKKNDSRRTGGGPGGSEVPKIGGDNIDGASISQKQNHNHRRIPSTATMSTSNTSLSNTSTTVQTSIGANASAGAGGIVGSVPSSTTGKNHPMTKPHHHKTISELSTISAGSGVSTGSGTARSTTAAVAEKNNDSQHQAVSSSGNNKHHGTSTASATAIMAAVDTPQARLIVKKFRSTNCSAIDEQREQQQQQQQYKPQPSPKTMSKVSQLLKSIELEEVVDSQQKSLSYDIPLSFRPLSPCVVPSWWKLSQEQEQEQEQPEHQVCVWVGSADDSKLRLYVGSIDSCTDIDQENEVVCLADGGVKSTPAAVIDNPTRNDFANNQQPSLDNDPMIEHVLPKEHFAVDTPVLGIDYKTVTWNTTHGNHESSYVTGHSHRIGAETTTKTSHILALSCQDGTIKLIMWDDKESNEMDDTKKRAKPHIPFHNIRHHTVMIDGPVVCLRLDFCEAANVLRVVAGSLCGYAAQLLYDHRRDSWHGPYMLIQGILNPLIGQEDAILSVDIYNNYLAIGTHAGRCCLFATENSEMYFKVWECILPYSVNEVAISYKAHSDDRGRKDDQIGLAVTTRRSFHLFRSTTSTNLVDWKIKPRACPPHYSSDLAKSRLDAVLGRIKRKNEEANAAKQVIVEEVMEGLITKVVEMGPFPVQVVATDPTLEGQDRDAIIHHNANDVISSQPSEQVAADIQNPPLEYSDSEEEDNLNSIVASDEKRGREKKLDVVIFPSQDGNEQVRSSNNDLDDGGGDDDYVLIDLQPPVD